MQLFTFRRHSTIGQIWRLYAFLGLLGATGLGFLSWEIVQLREITNKGLLRTREAQVYTLQLSNELNKMAYSTSQYWLFKREYALLRTQSTWKERVFAYQDSLKVLIYKFEDENLRNKVNNIREEVMVLENIWKQSLETPERLDKIDKQFELQLGKTQKAINNLLLDKMVAFRNGSNALNNMREQIFYTIFLFIIAIVLTGMIWVMWILIIHFKTVERINNQLTEYTKGNLPPVFKSRLFELTTISQTLNNLTSVFSRLKNLSIEVGAGKFDTEIRPFGGKGEIGNEVTQMRLSLKRIVSETNERNWFNEGFAQIGEILRRNNRDENFYEILISHVVKYLDVTQGGLFALTPNKKMMQMKAAYAFSRQKYIIKEIEMGEGLVGRVWREKDTVHITDIPPDYAEISSGLGGIQPRSIFLAPLITDNEVVGVLEFAGLQPFAPHQINFIKQIGESIAATIIRIQIDTETNRLLEESQAMSIRLTEQEEETRQSLEEVTSAQELMARNTYEIERQLQALDEVFMMMDFDIHGNFVRVNQNLLQVSGYHPTELVKNHFSILLGARSTDNKVLADWQTIMSGNIIAGEFIRYNKTGQKFWMYEVIYPLFGKDGKITKISSIGYEITKQKEQERQIHEQLKELQMSKRDVVNRIREVESKATNRIQRVQTELQEKIQEKDRIIQELKGV